MVYPSYAWLLYGWYSVEWWRTSNVAVNCSEDQLAAVLERALVVQQYPIGDNLSHAAVGGLVGLNNSLHTSLFA